VMGIRLRAAATAVPPGGRERTPLPAAGHLERL
jgi:hypothetical protein